MLWCAVKFSAALSFQASFSAGPHPTSIFEYEAAMHLHEEAADIVDALRVCMLVEKADEIEALGRMYARRAHEIEDLNSGRRPEY
jgi:hypothetical protein